MAQDEMGRFLIPKCMRGCLLPSTVGLWLGVAAQAHAACQIFEGPTFSGTAFTIANNGKASDLGGMNDKISSVKVSPQCLMQAYADPDFKGAQTTFGPGEHPRLADGWDDQISSARCNCR